MMYYEVCYDSNGKNITSLYEQNYRYDRAGLSVICYDPKEYEIWLFDGYWLYERLKYCDENNLELAGFDEQRYILCEDCEEYIPIVPTKTQWIYEFRFKKKDDAIKFKLIWC